MSATMATSKQATQTQPEDNSEYEGLLDRVTKVELDYKLGDVDGKISVDDGSGKVRWTFMETLDELEKLVCGKYKERFEREHPAAYFKFKAVQAEAKEYYDSTSSTYRHDLYSLAQDLYRDLPKRVDPGDDKERVVLKNKIRVIVGGLEHLYSIADFANAINYAHGLKDFVETSGLMTRDKPAHGTLAVIYNFLGRAHRQRGIDDDYKQAIDYFYKCSESYFEMAQSRKGSQTADVIYARTRAMVSLAFGAGFLFYNAQSDLDRAKALIAQARLAFLRDDATFCCELHYNYLELLYASILRAEAGELISEDTASDDKSAAERTAAEDRLNTALRILEECGKVLVNKPKYFVHMLYNKALVYMYLGPKHYPESHECVTQLLSMSQDNPRWLANGLILKSHLARRTGNFEAAQDDALKACNLAGNHLPVRIEALLTLGQAQIERGKLTAARDEFEKALELNNSANQKLTAMTNLLLVDVAIKQRQPSQAYERFNQVKNLMPSIRHGFIRNKFNQLAAVLDEIEADFVIPATAEKLDYKELDSKLQYWLLEKALREDTNPARVAERLNVTKKTIYLWLKKYNIRV